MLSYRLCASKYLAAIVCVYLTHHPVCVHWQRMDGLDDLPGHLQLAGIFDQPGPTADLVCYPFSLLAPNAVATLQMALELTGQNAVSALGANCQSVLHQMLEILACNAVLCHGCCIGMVDG
jgi:hypothetical protein